MRERMKKLVMSSTVIVVAVVVFVGTVGSVYALTIDGGRLKSALNEAAKVQVIANTLKRCIPDIKSRSSGGGNVPGLSSQDVKQGDIFGGNSVMVGNTPISGTNVATGPWLENAIDHKGGDDGDIWCAENHGEIIKLFAQYVLGSRSSYMNGIVCDANGEAGGIFMPYSDDGKTEFGCSSAVRYQKKSDDEITNYIKGLYEAKRHELGNDYWVSWDNLGNYTDQRGRAVGYWLYWNDFDTRCKSNDAETNRKTVSLDYGGETFGLVQDETVRVRANWESASFNNIIGNTFTCKTLRDRMDGYAADYAAVSVDYLGSQCKEQLTPVIEGKLEEYRNALASGTVDVQTASNYINKWGNYGSMGNNDFVEQTEKGGYVCNEDAGAKVDFAVDQLTPEESIATGENDACYAGSGALGWIICPVVKGISGVGEHMWEQIETHHLKIPVGEMFGSNSGAATAWGVIRNIANILFIILFLMVIFSQLTGIGIDNYGIKRILPKLIIVAILVNLSYIICELAIDLSNIFGIGINDLLSDAAGNIDIGAPSGIVSQASGGIAVLGLVGGGAWLYTLLNPLGVVALGLAVLGIVITIVVSMFFLYLTLVVREAGIILLVVISPIALVCYMLPNTERYYKKWFDLFKALLIVYPICGALIGAGKLAGAVLASIDTPSMKVAAMLVQVIPFFLIPTLLKNSLSLMGNVGARLSGWGRSLGRRGSNAAQGAIRGTRAVQDYSRYNQDRRSLARAERIRDRLGNRLNSGANLSARERSQWATASHQVAAAENQKEREYGEIFERYERPQVQAEFATAIGGDDAERASAALTSLLQKGGIDEALTIMDGNNWNNMSQNVRDRLLQTMGGTNIDAMKSFAKYRQTGGQAEFKDWSRGTGAVIASEASNAAIKDKTFAAHLLENGEHATDSYSKDEMQFINRRSSDLIGLMGQQQFGRTLSSMAMNSKDAKAQTEMEKVITREIGGGTLSVSDLGLTAESIGRMRGDFARALEAGYVNAGKTRANLQADLAPQIAAASADSRISNRTDADVKTILGMP